MNTQTVETNVPPRRSNTTRNVLIVLGVIVGLCCLCGIGLTVFGGSLVGRMASPEAAGDNAAKITEYTLPNGYEGLMGMDMMGMFTMAGFEDPGSDRPALMLMQVPGNADMSEEQMQSQMEQSMGQQGLNMEQVDTQPATIRNQDVELTVSEGTDDAGNQLRQMMGAFEGKGGTAFFMALGPVDGWDQDAIDEFLASTNE